MTGEPGSGPVADGSQAGEVPEAWAARAEDAAEALRRLRSAGWTLAVAESLTGGLVAAELTQVPGASAVFRGSVTAYATDLKHRLLGVDADLLAVEGAVHEQVALQMAAGVRRALGADWGLATTGVAGPGTQGGMPVGTVYVAVSGPLGVGNVARLRLNGDRGEIRRESARSVLALLLRELTVERLANGRAPDAEQTAEQTGGT